MKAADVRVVDPDTDEEVKFLTAAYQGLTRWIDHPMRQVPTERIDTLTCDGQTVEVRQALEAKAKFCLRTRHNGEQWATKPLPRLSQAKAELEKFVRSLLATLLILAPLLIPGGAL